jgi:hypothetical protein
MKTTGAISSARRIAPGLSSFGGSMMRCLETFGRIGPLRKDLFP